MSDKKVDIEINLDTAEGIQQALHLKNVITDIGNPENLTGLIEGLTTVGSLAGVLGVAFLALKGTVDAVFDAENIKALNAEFEILTENAGISGEALKSGMEKASAGMLTENEQLELANKALVQMGSAASKLPEIMELARKTTAVFGGDLKDNIEKIGNAIAFGNARMLKHQGIIIDTNKALKDFADSHNTTVAALNAAGKSQAILNAALEYGQSKMSGINPELKDSQNTWTRIKVELKEISELLEIAWAKMASPAVNGLLHAGAMTLAMIKGTLQGIFGTAKKGMEDVNASVGGKSPESKDIEDKQKAKEREAVFQKDMMKFKEENNKSEIALSDNLDNYEKLATERKLLLYEQYQKSVDALDARKDITEQQKRDEEIELKRQFQNKELAMDEQLEQEREAVMNRGLQHAKTTQDGFVKAAQISAAKQKYELTNSGKSGEAALKSLEKHSTDAFHAMGDGSKSAGEAMAGMAANVAADRADMFGKVFFLEGIAEFNPPKIAAGAALQVLAGALRSAGGGGGSSISSGGGVGGSGGGSSSAPVTNTSTVASQATPQKQVAINIGGNYYDNAQTRQELAQIVRDNLDATDFNIKRIGES